MEQLNDRVLVGSKRVISVLISATQRYMNGLEEQLE